MNFRREERVKFWFTTRVLKKSVVCFVVFFDFVCGFYIVRLVVGDIKVEFIIVLSCVCYFIFIEMIINLDLFVFVKCWILYEDVIVICVYILN